MENKFSIECPACGVKYTEINPVKEIVTCMNGSCNCEYIQYLHKVENFNFVRKALQRRF